MVTFLPLNEEWIGFGEAHPADGNRKDGAASQQNRRVEILFFESGQEPDVTILKEAPEITELYSLDAFVREAIVTGHRLRKKRLHLRFVDDRGEPLAPLDYRIETNDGFFVEGRAENGSIRKILPSGTTRATLTVGEAELSLVFEEGRS